MQRHLLFWCLGLSMSLALVFTRLTNGISDGSGSWSRSTLADDSLSPVTHCIAILSSSILVRSGCSSGSFSRPNLAWTSYRAYIIVIVLFEIISSKLLSMLLGADEVSHCNWLGCLGDLFQKTFTRSQPCIDWFDLANLQSFWSIHSINCRIEFVSLSANLQQWGCMSPARQKAFYLSFIYRVKHFPY